MFTEDQHLYLTDVLGIQSAGFVLAGEASLPELSPAEETVLHDVLVLTPPLDQPERDLLLKILASIRLQDYHHEEAAGISLAELPAGLRAKNILAFAEYPPGKNVFGAETWWVLPPVARMTGGNAEVVARKKETWNLLQQFSKERS